MHDFLSGNKKLLFLSIETQWDVKDTLMGCHAILMLSYDMLFSMRKKGYSFLLLASKATIETSKNLGRLWLAYTGLQGKFCMLLISFDSRMWACHDTIRYQKGSWAFVDWNCPAFLWASTQYESIIHRQIVRRASNVTRTHMV